MFPDSGRVRLALQATGELLAADRAHVSIVVVGGVALNLRGFISRTTLDVDVIAQLERRDADVPLLTNADPFPPALRRAIATVARDLRLPPAWMNHEVALQWKRGLPPDLLEDVVWETFGGLSVGLVGRQALITLKFFAAVDAGAQSVHMQDLLTLAPAPEELGAALAWVLTQDAGPDFPRAATETADYVTRRTHQH
jgi:Nucleotidyltransferase of unknown function (DUF6036)